MKQDGLYSVKFSLDFYAHHTYDIVVRRLQYEIPGNRENYLSRWILDPRTIKSILKQAGL